MPFDLGPSTATAIAFALLGAAFVRGYSGFGFSAIFIAFAALLTNPLPLIPVVFVCEIVMTTFQAGGMRGHIAWRRVSSLLLGALLAVPFSVSVMLSLGADTARIAISSVIMVTALLLLSGWTLQRQIGARGHGAVGVLSGLCNAAGIGGLPVAAFLSAQPMPPARFRASMIVYLTGLDLITLPLLWWGGLVTWHTVWAAALALPLLGLGVWLGGRQFLAASPATFRRFAVVLLLVLSGLGLLRAALGC